MNKLTMVKYPYEYFAAQIYFAYKIARETKENICAVCKQYTNLYGAMTNDTYANDTDRNWVNIIIQKFEEIVLYTSNPEEATQKVYDLFLENTHVSQVTLTYPKAYKKGTFGCFRYNFNDYYKNSNLIRLHFSPTRKGLFAKVDAEKAGDLSRVYVEERKKEFSDLINYIYNNPHEFEGAKYFMSSTWLQNVPAYQSFFPSKYSVEASLRAEVKNSYWWVWGQFIKWNLTGNKRLFANFLEKLNSTSNLEEILSSIPYSAYEIKVPLEELFEMYVLQDAYIVTDSEN